MKIISKTLMALALALPLSCLAGEAEEQLIDKVTQAYGGQALLDINSYRIKEHYLTLNTGQSSSPALTEMAKQAQVLLVDIDNNKAVFDSLFIGRGGHFQNSVVTDGENGYAINYQTNTYGDSNSADVYVLAGGTMRTSDTILVYQLNKAAEQAKVGDDELFNSRKHHTVTMPFPSSPDLKLYIDAETHMVSRMLRVNAQLGNLDYIYSDYKTDKGIKYASSTVFAIGGSPNLISTHRELSFNPEIAANAFSVPEGFVKQGETIDTSEMIVNKISERVYHLGQANGYSMFVDTGSETLAVGGYPALPSRFDRYKQESDNHKTLSYQVVTHHHSDHLGAIPEAVSLGARIVTVDENIAEIQANTTPAPENRDFLVVSKRATFGQGRNRAEIYEVSTVHAQSFLVTYVPAAKTVFLADHLGSQFATGVPVAGQGTVDMLAALAALNIDIKKIATAHSARIFSMQDLRDSVAAFQPSSCKGNRPVCDYH